MKAKVFVGPPESGKSRVAEIIRDMNPDRTFCVDGLILKDEISIFDLYGMNSECDTLIIDNVGIKKRFSFEALYSRFTEKGFEVWVDRRNGDPIQIILKNLIIITESIGKELADSASFKARFDVIEFPLTK